jgi:hypothetical protein
MDFVKANLIPLGKETGGERFIQQLLADDPTLLTLGDLILRDKERNQPSGARLDLLFETQDGKRWYEVEVQLGSTNETHIIRTIEYWDTERKRYPAKEHVAVIVAEQITSRYFNVISLFNQHIPLIAIQMNALEVGGKKTVHFTKVLDLTLPGDEDEATYQPADRAYWEKRASKPSMEIVDEILTFAREKDSQISPRYNKAYIGITLSGQTFNFLTMRAQKKAVRLSVTSPKKDEYDQLISEAGFEIEYDDRWKKYILYLDRESFGTNRRLVKSLVERAYDFYKEDDFE